MSAYSMPSTMPLASCWKKSDTGRSPFCLLDRWNGGPTEAGPPHPMEVEVSGLALQAAGLLRRPSTAGDLVDRQYLGLGVAVLVEPDVTGRAGEADTRHRLDGRLTHRVV